MRQSHQNSVKNVEPSQYNPRAHEKKRAKETEKVNPHMHPAQIQLKNIE